MQSKTPSAVIDISNPALFNDVYIAHLHNYSREQIFFGGAGSGKSVFVAQRCVIRVLSGRNQLIGRQVARTIRKSVFNEIEKVISAFGLAELFSTNKSEMTITCQNGYQVLFVGLDDVEKLKSITPAKGVIDDVWIEEATETTEASIKQVFKRQRGGDPNSKKTLTLSFNPVYLSHWIYKKYFADVGWTNSQTEHQQDGLSIQKTWYIHNRFLTPSDVYDYENESDPYLKDVYTLGNWGVLGDVIFTNWSIDDLSDMRDQFTDRRVGLDFGFSADPAAMSICHYDKKRKTIYIYGELYEHGLTNDLLAIEIKKVFRSVGMTDQMGRRELITADSSEPKSIVELRNSGLNVRGAKKGPDSVNFGIQWLQQQEIIIDKSCIQTQNEFKIYQWAKDRHGNKLKRPVDKNNHIIDELRYAFEGDATFGGIQFGKNPMAGYRG
jgi:phage terminase large subunit